MKYPFVFAICLCTSSWQQSLCSPLLEEIGADNGRLIDVNPEDSSNVQPVHHKEFLFSLVKKIAEKKDSIIAAKEPLNEKDEADNSTSTSFVLLNDTEVGWKENTIILKANSSLSEVEKIAEEYMQFVNEISAVKQNQNTLASWAYEANITELNKNLSIKAATDNGAFVKQQWFDLQTWKEFWPKFRNESLKRQFKLYSVLGTPALPAAKLEELTKLTTDMGEIYSTATICDYHNSSRCDLQLEPDLTSLLAKSKDYDELTHVWKEWRDASGKKIKELYKQYVNLSNEAAEINGFASMAEMWLYPYESETFEKDVIDLFQQMSPLYNQLHAYVRRKLREVYGEEKVTKTGAIPAHLLGNMWAQTWDRIYDILEPYPNRSSQDASNEMIAQNYTQKKIFETADDFFASLGLERVSSSFWKNSIIEKPTDRKIVCHASAWDFYDGKDFRIKQCTSVNMEDLATVHHEMGHIQYYIQYKSLPYVFRDGANKGFHEAIGDIMSLSVSTPKHLHKIGLSNTGANEYEDDINFLMISALRKVAFLPFGYLIDRFRWDTFRGLVSPDNYTCAWWNYRYDLQGIKPPVPRTSNDFDPAAKFHVAANVQYVQYFASFVLQFQFHKSLCLLAGEYDPTDPLKPLHQCDIYQSLQAGSALRDLLKVGSSQHWSATLKALTGTDKMDLSALLEYFKPLEDWLQEDNKKHGEFIGWKGGHGVC